MAIVIFSKCVGTGNHLQLLPTYFFHQQPSSIFVCIKFLFLSLLLSFFNVPEIDLSEMKTSDFDILFLAFDDLMDKPWFLRAGFESVRIGGELAVHARKGHYDKLKVRMYSEFMSSRGKIFRNPGHFKIL